MYYSYLSFAAMKTFFFTALFLIFGLSSTTHAQPAPLRQPFQQTTEKEEVEAPKAADLKPNWWSYFEVSGDELRRRIDESLSQLEAVVRNLPQSKAAAARPLLDRLRTNLEALPPAKDKPSPEPPPPLAAASSYTPKQMLQIARRFRDVQRELDEGRNEVAASVDGIEAAMHRIDTHLAAYLELTPTNPDRVLRGLEIMADRAAVAVAEERLRVRRATLEANEKLAEQLLEEQGVASQRLITEPDDLNRLDRQLEQAQTMLDKAREELTTQQASALTVQPDDPEGKARAYYQQQQVIRAEVIEAIAEIRLLRFQAEHGLLSLLLDKEDMDSESLRDKLVGWEAQIQNIRNQATVWTADSQRELDRASELVAGAAGDLDLVRSLEMIAVKVLNQDRLNLAQETLVSLERLQDALIQTETVLQIVDQHLASKEGEFGKWMGRGERLLKHLWYQISERVSASLFKIGGTPVTALGLLRVAVILFIAWWISSLLRRALARLGKTHEGINQSALYTIARLAHYCIITVGLMVGLASVGLNFTSFAIVAGAIGIGIGFGLQSIVSNFVSGLIVLFERSMKVGDFIELDSGITGEVREINVRSTLINTNDNVDVVVPNSEFINAKVINWTLIEEHRRVHIPFKVALDSDLELVEKAALEAAGSVPQTLQGGRNGVWLVDFGNSGLEYELVVWVTPQAVKRPGATAAAYRRAILASLRRHGIEVPLPQRVLRMHRSAEKLLKSPHMVANREMPASSGD